MQKSVTVQLPTGADARPVAVLVQIANQYECKVYLDSRDKSINAKSIMGVMSMAIKNGDEITISTSGTDEEAALNHIAGYLSGQTQ